jgi:aspartate kinase
MAVIVQKYGGSSLADAEKIKNVAKRAARAEGKGDQVVVVVSAMGDSTDKLITLANQVSDQPHPRELDVLSSTGEVVSSTLVAMSLRSLGMEAISLSGGQAGIRTDATHGRAVITDVDPQRITWELKRGRIVIVAGFQGITEEMDVTTLGRGGSDTTAVALAVSLGADRCEIYTDVDGVHTADPRVAPEARKLEEIGYEEMLELATHGAKVLHSRAVELGELYKMPIVVASSFGDNPGTLIHGGAVMEAKNKVRGIAHDLSVAKVTVMGVPDRPGIVTAIFEPLAEAGVCVDTIVQNASVNNVTDVTFTIAKSDLNKVMEVVKPVAESIGALDCVGDTRLAKISVVGAGIQTASGYAARMFRALYDEGINIELISTSEIRITCIVDEARTSDAVRALHKAFELETGD